MKKFIGIVIIVIFFSLKVPTSVNARSGCCSHHGGVVGCGCGDGTPLSAICAPYYPECSSGFIQSAPTYNTPITPRPVMPKPTLKSTIIPTPKSTIQPTFSPVISSSPIPTDVNISTFEPNAITRPTVQQSYGFWSWLRQLLGRK